MSSPKCPHCGKSMSHAEITEDYQVVYTCDCKDAETSSRKLRKNPDKSLCAHCGELHEMKYCCGICNAELHSRDCLEGHFEEKHPHHLIANPEKNTLKEAERYLLDRTRETHDRYIALALVEAKYGTDIALKVGEKYRIGRERAIHHGTDLDTRDDPVIVNPRLKEKTLIHIADERGFKTLCGLDVHGVGVGFKKEDITCTKCLRESSPRRAKKNPLEGTDEWGHKLFIENPTREELQDIADSLGVPVGIEKEIGKEMEMYKRFHNRKPTEIVRVEHPATPKSLIALGKLESIIYRKCTDNQAYIHDLKHGILAADRKGKLWIIGDKARITKRGIVG